MYQPSSGALYPALRRLERAGLLCAEPRSPDGQQRARRRFVYHLTERGRAAHNAWVRRPVPSDLPGGRPLARDGWQAGDRVRPVRPGRKDSSAYASSFSPKYG